MQHARELIDRMGLLQELEAAGAVLRQNMAIATGQHDRQVKVTAADFPGKVDAGHALPAWLIPGVATLDIVVAGGDAAMPWARELNLFALAVGTMVALA